MDAHVKIGDSAIHNFNGIVAVIDDPLAGVVPTDGMPAPVKGDPGGLDGNAISAGGSDVLGQGDLVSGRGQFGGAIVAGIAGFSRLHISITSQNEQGD